MNIGGVEIGPGQPCRTVAEISCNHNGKLSVAINLIHAAKRAGADFVKFQCYTPDELVALRGDGPAPAQWGEQGWTMQRLYEKARTPHDWFPSLVDTCDIVGIPWFSSVFGLRSLVLMEELGCPAYKIAALDRKSEKLFTPVVSRGKPVLISTPERDEGRVMFWGETGHLYCPPGYPSKVEDVRLPWFSGVGNEGFLGLSSHCMDPLLPAAAVARGAKLIEMHMQLGGEPSELEANISLTEKQWAEMVANIRRTEALLGEPVTVPNRIQAASPVCYT